MTDDEQQYEYAVMHWAYPDEPHRGPWPREQAVQWVKESSEIGFREGAFYVVRRPVGQWERVDD